MIGGEGGGCMNETIEGYLLASISGSEMIGHRSVRIYLQ